MITKEQRERRKKGIFASDVSRIFSGDSVPLAMEKLGQKEPADLDDVVEVQLGQIIEPKVLDAYEQQYPALSYERSPDTMFHPEHPWFGAHLDEVAIQLEQRINTECKTVGWYKRSDWGDGGDEIPLRVLWQVQAQMAVSRIRTTHIPVCFINEEALKLLLTGKLPPIKVFVVPADVELEYAIIERASYVWNCIQEERLPRPERLSDFQLVYPKDNGTIVEAEDFIVETHSSLMKTKQEIKELEEKVSASELIIKSFMKDASHLMHNGQILATWKKDRDGEQLNKELLAQDEPELYQQYLIPRIGSRKFLPKKLKE